MGNCKICGKKLRGAKEGYCSFECLMNIAQEQDDYLKILSKEE